MAKAGIDVLMMVTNKGKVLPCENQTVFNANMTIDTLAQGFTSGQCCELDFFNFSAGVAPALDQQPEPVDEDEPGPRLGPKTRIIRAQGAKLDARRKAEVVDMQPVNYARMFDTASTLLFQSLVACDTIDSIAVIKRKAAGTAASGETYLRLDFTKVLLTGIDWSDAGPVMVESASFIYRQLRMRYRPQNANGSLGTTIESNWTMKTGSK